MSRLAYRNVPPPSFVACPDGEYLATAQTIRLDNTGNGSNVTGVRYYTIKTPSSTPTIVYQGNIDDSGGTLYYAMPSSAIDKSGVVGYTFTVSGPQSSSTYPSIYADTLDASGNLGTATVVQAGSASITDSCNHHWGDFAGHRIRKVSKTGTITTVAGTGVSGYSGDGGKATAAQLWYPFGVAVDSAGNLFIADSFNGVIRRVDTSGIISTFATNANFSGLGAMAVDPVNNLYVVDQGTCVVWQISPSGVVVVLAGTEFVCGFGGDGGPATVAQLNTPFGVAVDKHGQVFVADSSK